MTWLAVLAVLLLKVTLVLLMATGVAFALRRAPAATRHAVWLATLIVLLLVPVLSRWSLLPVRIVPPVSIQVTTGAFATDSASPMPAEPTDTVSTAVGAPVRATPRATIPRTWFLRDILFAIWLTVAVAILGWLTFGWLSVKRIVRASVTLVGETWTRPLYESADRLNLDRAPRLVMSAAAEMPFACGLLRPTVVLPPAAQEWSDERRRSVLFHELAHIRRGDLLGHTIGRIACAVYWFHPMVWGAAKAMRAESERSCDDLTLRSGEVASDYANHLLEIVTSVRAHSVPATALPMANKKAFEGRIIAILDPDARRAPTSRRRAATVGAVPALAALTIAAVSPQQRSTQQPLQQPQSRQVSVAPETVVVMHNKAPLPQLPAALSTQANEPAGANVALDLNLVQPQSTQPVTRATVPTDTVLLFRLVRTDPDRQVRRVAAWALGHERSAIPVLIERLRGDDDAKVREMAAWALGNMPAIESEDPLGEALANDIDARVRGTAAWSLGRATGRLHEEELRRALSDESPLVRERATWALSRYNFQVAPHEVVAVLRDPDAKVRTLAAWMLTNLPDSSSAPAIRAAFLEETNAEAQHAQFRAMYFLGLRDSLVIKRGLESPSGEVRERALRLYVGKHPGGWSWPWVWPDVRALP